MRRLLPLMICGFLIVGCNHTDHQFLGQWEGGFEPASAPPGTPVDQLKMKGSLHIFLNESKFSLELSNPIQVMKFEGHWQRISANRIALRVGPHGIAVDEPSLDKTRAMKRAFLEPTAIMGLYGKPLILDLHGDTLTGLLVTLGPMTGNHVFHRGG